MTAFAVRLRDIRQRANVKYAAASRTIGELYGRARYPLVPLRELVTLVQYGSSEAANTDEVGLPMVRMNNLQDEHWDFSEIKHVDLSPIDAQRFRLEPGDILFNRTNSEELV